MIATLCAIWRVFISLAFTGSGGLDTRFGHLAGGVSDLVAIKGGTATTRVLSGASWQTRGGTIDADAAASPSLAQQADGFWQNIVNWQQAQNGLIQSAQNL